MKFLVVGLKKNIQFKRLVEEGKKSGHQVDGCLASDLLIKASQSEFSVELKNGRNLADYDLIYLWAMGYRRWEWYLAADILLKEHRVQIVNEKVVLEDYQYYLTPSADYLRQTSANIPYPKTLVTFPGKSFSKASAVKKLGFPLIIKVSASRQGRGVYKVNSKEELTYTLTNLEKEKKAIIFREYIPNDGDIRVFTVGYHAIGAMKRIPKKGDFRSNISQGGEGKPYDLEQYPQVRIIAEELSKITRTEIAGVDIMINKDTKEPYVLEINPGPQFKGFEKYTKVNAAGAIIRYFESKVSAAN